MFPYETERFRRVTIIQLVYQGIFLHYASFWGPLRSSTEQRNKDSKWAVTAFTRWIQEYGGNAALLLMLQLLIASNEVLRIHWLASTSVSLLIPPALSILQMFLDNLRKDSRVFFDTKSHTGLTIKAYKDENGTLVWSYFNHFALPIGAKNGRNIRTEIDRQAQELKIVLTCNAQNQTIADFYLRDNPRGVNQDGKRPLMVWNYSGKSWRERKSSLFQSAFGINSTRNSGQIPLGRERLSFNLA